MEAAEPRKRGRPKGSRNVPALARPILSPPAGEVKADYKHADIDTIVSRQLSMLDWAQQALRNEMMRGYQAKGVSIALEDLEKLDRMSHAIMRAVDALKKSGDLAEEISKKLSPEQLLDAALAKIEAQDVRTLKWAIRRLRAYLEKLGPVTRGDQMAMGEAVRPAAEAIASLGDE